MSGHTSLRIAVFGATRTGRSRLVSELEAALGAAPASSRPPPFVAEGSLCPEGHPQLTPAPASETRALRADRVQITDLVLLTGLDLPVPGTLAARQAAEDARLRQALQGAGLGWRVVYGQGPQRTRHALQALAEAAPWAWTATVSEAEAGRWQRLTASCEKCGDAACEHRLFTGLAPG